MLCSSEHQTDRLSPPPVTSMTMAKASAGRPVAGFLGAASGAMPCNVYLYCLQRLRGRRPVPTGSTAAQTPPNPPKPTHARPSVPLTAAPDPATYPYYVLYLTRVERTSTGGSKFQYQRYLPANQLGDLTQFRGGGHGHAQSFAAPHSRLCFASETNMTQDYRPSL